MPSTSHSSLFALTFTLFIRFHNSFLPLMMWLMNEEAPCLNCLFMCSLHSILTWLGQHINLYASFPHLRQLRKLQNHCCPHNRFLQFHILPNTSPLYIFNSFFFVLAGRQNVSSKFFSLVKSYPTFMSYSLIVTYQQIQCSNT